MKYLIIFCALCCTIKPVYGNTYGTISDYGLYTMAASPFAYSLYKHDKKMLAVSAGAHVVNIGATSLAKLVSHRLRPDESNYDSFWSGHTSTSAVSSGLLCYMNKKACIPGLAMTAAVGTLRVMARKHFMSDVLIGFYVGFMNGYVAPTLVFGL